MIILTKLTIKGVKKAHKSYKTYQAEKENRLRIERGELPVITDPSRELTYDKSCLAERRKSVDSNASDVDDNDNDNDGGSVTSSSADSARAALENDPDFQQFMERQRQLYLTEHRPPPSYDAATQRERRESTRHRRRRRDRPATGDQPLSPAAVVQSPTTTSTSMSAAAADYVMRPTAELSPDSDITTFRSGTTTTTTTTTAHPSSSSNYFQASELDSTELQPHDWRPNVSSSNARSPVGVISELPSEMPASNTSSEKSQIPIFRSAT